MLRNIFRKSDATTESPTSTTRSGEDSLRDRFRYLWSSLKERVKENEFIQGAKHYLPELNFITIHYFYFITVCLIFSVIFWGSSSPGKSIDFTDCLFLVISAMTEAGLNTINLSQMTTFQQVLLWLLIMIGSTIWVSIGTLLTRKNAFEKMIGSVARSGKGRGRTETPMLRAPSSLLFRDRGESLGERGPGNTRAFESRHSIPRDPTSSAPNGGPVVDSEENKPLDHAEPERPVMIQQSTASQDNKTPDENTKPISPASAVGLGLGLDKKISGNTVLTPTSENGTTANPRIRFDSIAEADRISPVMRYAPTSPQRPGSETPHHRILSFVGVGAHPNSTSAYRSPYPTGLSYRGQSEKTVKLPDLEDETRETEALDHREYPHYLTKHTTGRNAQFYGLSRDEREHLGGVEYRAVRLLTWVVSAYFFLCQSLGAIGLGWYMANNKADTARGNGINPWWLGIFNAISAFNNSGMSLLDANMIPFQTSTYTLITMGFLILAGNTAYPLFLRLILWGMLRFVNFFFPAAHQCPSFKSTLLFILRYPRRVYTNLFPSQPTWWLLFMLVVLNGIDWTAFEVLDLSNPAVQAIPHKSRVLDGLFQALAVRSGGFYVIAITNLRIGVQVLYVIMMYISVYPVTVTMRHSNVYEERSLGIYADEEDSSANTSPTDSDAEEGRAGHQPPRLGKLYGTLKRTFTTLEPGPFAEKPSSRTTTGTQFVRQQVRGQLAHDLWWLVLAVFLVVCIEVSNFDRDPITYSVFNVVFEVVSGYGCVGISTGLPDQAYSFSGGWHKVSKLILCAVMLRGRHRGLPVALDKAVRLPEQGDSGEKEEEDRVLRRTRSWSVGARTGLDL